MILVDSKLSVSLCHQVCSKHCQTKVEAAMTLALIGLYSHSCNCEAGCSNHSQSAVAVRECAVRIDVWRAICTDPSPLCFHTGSKYATINQRLLAFLEKYNTMQSQGVCFGRPVAAW